MTTKKLVIEVSNEDEKSEVCAWVKTLPYVS
jgi:hypothetical protein